MGLEGLFAMTAAEAIVCLLGIISGLLGIIAFFLSRLISKIDGLTIDVHKIRSSFLLFRQRVSIMLGLPVEDEDDQLTPSTSGS